MQVSAWIKETLERFTFGRGIKMPFVRMKAEPFRVNRAVVVLLVTLAAASISVCGCGKDRERYAAEKSLFRARKMRDELIAASMKRAFLEKTLQSYNSIVEDHKDSIGLVKGLEEIVVAAQMEMSDLEFRAGMLETARDDFKKAYNLSKNIPAARANALYSAAFISEKTSDYTDALMLYEKFHGEFLNQEFLIETAGMNTRYMIVPLTLSSLYRNNDDSKKADMWLSEAERIYLYLIENEEDPSLIKEMRFNLLTTYLQGERWNKALEKVRDLKKSYSGPTDLPSLLFLEAKIYQDGSNISGKAVGLFAEIYKDYPESKEAPSALLAAGAIQTRAKKYDEAEALYEKVIDDYGDAGPEVVEAAWQLAQIAEIRNNWVDASLRYKSIYANHPETLQGFEAPLRIAEHFRDKGDLEAAQATYARAIEHYEGLVSSHVSPGIKIMAEEYIVRTFAEQKKWHEVIERLLELPDRYPDYIRFMENYLKAASIHENELGRKDKAAEVLRTCIDKYPGTDLAVEAGEHLKRLEGSQ
ncbi:MAG: tetratricopeptide repeat protein [Candidatus Krumholzibacteria bacterium]|nr:tetratricopeptide repeat protein [Candidatus Krumholzibacteria bacterium]